MLTNNNPPQQEQQQQTKKRVRDEEKMEELQNQFDCSICFEPMAAVCTLNCGCSFCYKCIHDWHNAPNQTRHCPLCKVRFDLYRTLDNKRMTSIIRTCIAAGLIEADPAAWEERVAAGIQERKNYASSLKNYFKDILNGYKRPIPAELQSAFDAERIRNLERAVNNMESDNGVNIHPRTLALARQLAADSTTSR